MKILTACQSHKFILNFSLFIIHLLNYHSIGAIPFDSRYWFVVLKCLFPKNAPRARGEG